MSLHLPEIAPIRVVPPPFLNSSSPLSHYELRSDLPDEGPRTNRGIDWVGNDYCLDLKIWLGLWADYLERLYGRLPMGKSDERALAETVVRLFPDVITELERLLTRKTDLGYALLHRARFAGTTVIQHGKEKGNEVQRFIDNPAWRPTASVFMQSFSDASLIFPKEKLAKLREQGLIITHRGGGPGVYLRQDPALRERIYWGSGGDVIERGVDGHRGDHKYLAAVFVFPSEAEARRCEDTIHKVLKNENRTYGVKSWRERTRGAYTFEDGVDGAECIYRLMRHYFPTVSRRLVLPSSSPELTVI